MGTIWQRLTFRQALYAGIAACSLVGGIIGWFSFEVDTET